jgi:hypothetical protein
MPARGPAESRLTASMMFTRAARRAGGTDPSRLIANAPRAKTSAMELGLNAMRKFIMSALTTLNSHWSVRPKTSPRTPPTAPMPAASANTIRNVNRRLDPIARSTPTSRRRSSTDSVNVFNSATVATNTTMIHTAFAMNML